MLPGSSRVLSEEEMLQRAAKRRRSQSVEGSLKTPIHVSEDTSASHATPKKSHPKAANVPPVPPQERVTISLPASFLARPDSSEGIWPEAEKLWLPEAAKRLKAMEPLALTDLGVEQLLQALQTSFSARDNLKEMAAKLERAERDGERLKSKLELAEDAKKFAIAEKAALEAELAKKAEEIYEKNVENEGLKKKVGLLQEEVLDIESESTMRGRAKMAYAVYVGGASKEDCKKVIDQYVEHIGDMKDLFPSGDAQEPVADAPKEGENEAGPSATTAEENVKA